MPYGLGGSRYYDPGSTYGSPYGYDFPTSPVGGLYLEQNQPFAFTRFLEGLNMGGEDALSRWARLQQGRAQSGYGAALATNPNLRFTDYLQGLGPNFFQQKFRELTPSQRGENVGAYSGRVRWIPR